MSQKPIPVTLDQVRWHRLRRSGLVTPFASPEAAASALVGAQAQILSAAGLALWNRTPEFSEAQLADLLHTRRTLVKLWGQRGTLHLYPSAEWPLVTGMLAGVKSWWGRDAARQDQYDEYSALVEEAAALLRARGIMGRADLRDSGLPIDDEHLSAWGGLFADLVRRGHACHAGRAENEGLFAARGIGWPICRGRRRITRRPTSRCCAGTYTRTDRLRCRTSFTGAGRRASRGAAGGRP